MPPHFRVFLIGLEQQDLDQLRVRSGIDDTLEVVGTALLQDIQRGIARPPDSTDAILMSGEAWTRRSVIAPTPPPEGRRDERLIEKLTSRERDALALVADGHPNREIAIRLGISEHTVKFHLASIFGKLGVSTRTEAVQRGLRLGVIEI